MNNVAMAVWVLNMNNFMVMRSRAAELAKQGQLDNAMAVDFALLFHNAIYDPTRSDNESRSAELWRQFAKHAPEGSPLSSAVVGQVAGFIERAAKHHDG